MRAMAYPFITMVFIIGLSSSVFAIHETIPAETQITLPGANASDLYTYIVKSDPYAKWRLWPGKGDVYPGTEPHGSLLTTYLNRIAYSAADKKTAMTDGAIIVQENYTSDRKLSALTVVYKIKGFNPAEGDWFWARYAPDGQVEASGKVASCINCHATRKDNDYIFSGPLK